MSRIDDYLDGEVAPSALTSQERADAEAAEAAVDAARRYITAQPAPDLTGTVMRAIEDLQQRPAVAPTRHAIRRFVEALWTARDVSFQVRPAYAVLGAVVVAAVLITMAGQPPTVNGANNIAAGEPQVFVQFRLEAADASDVRLAGSFSNWQPRYQLHQAAPGIWTITVPLAPGVHDYAFVVDGQQWMADPYAPQISDGFGGANSRIALLAPNGPRT